MTTKRLLVSLDENLYNDLEFLAKHKQKSLSLIAKKLIQTSLELDEDLYFSKLGDSRLSEPHKLISHQDAWK